MTILESDHTAAADHHHKISGTDKPHVVAIPYPAQGHINPALQLCLELADRGYTITFVNSLHNHHRILQHCTPSTLHALHAKGIRMLSIAGGLPPELHGYKSGGQQALLASSQMQQPFEELLSLLPRVDCILADVFLCWARHSAAVFGVPLLTFWAASAATLTALLHYADLAAQGATGLQPEEKNTAGHRMVSGIPGLPPTRTRDLPDVIDEKGQFRPVLLELVLKPFQHIPRAASCLLINTFAGLEDAVLRALSARVPTYAVGPLLHKEVHQYRPNLFPGNDGCLAWLDKQKPTSVLYVSFGSISIRSKKQMQELAMGLKASELPFSWVGRPSAHAGAEGDKFCYDVQEMLEGSVQVEGSGGMVVAWAPQLQVLAHPSVGGFMTHCGWNSVVESVAMGVPMLCWADTGERASNQRFVTEVWRCGVAMTDGDSPGPATFVPNVEEEEVVVGRDEVERTVRAFMGEDGDHLRARAAQLKAAATDASSSSSSNLDHVVKSVIKKSNRD